jgi:hypothetical protein
MVAKMPTAGTVFIVTVAGDEQVMYFNGERWNLYTVDDTEEYNLEGCQQVLAAIREATHAS